MFLALQKTHTGPAKTVIAAEHLNPQVSTLIHKVTLTKEISMTSLLTNQARPVYPNILHIALGKAGSVFQLFLVWNRTRKTCLVLSNLNDRTLADIGLTRGDIARMRSR